MPIQDISFRLETATGKKPVCANCSRLARFAVADLEYGDVALACGEHFVQYSREAIGVYDKQRGLNKICR